MVISYEDLRTHYASLSDEELLAIDRNELTDVGRQCYDPEIARRRLSKKVERDDGSQNIDAHDDAPDWLSTAAVACSFQVGAGHRYSEEAEEACTILSDAGIPSQVVPKHDDDGPPEFLEVMVPGALSLKAASILDRELFNEELEETWRTDFGELSDGELADMDVDELCAGLLNRAARLKRIYEGELLRRQSETTAA